MFPPSHVRLFTADSVQTKFSHFRNGFQELCPPCWALMLGLSRKSVITNLRFTWRLFRYRCHPQGCLYGRVPTYWTEVTWMPNRQYYHLKFFLSVSDPYRIETSHLTANTISSTQVFVFFRISHIHMLNPEILRSSSTHDNADFSYLLLQRLCLLDARSILFPTSIFAPQPLSDPDLRFSRLSKSCR
jgi:hypothetical protein